MKALPLNSCSARVSMAWQRRRRATHPQDILGVLDVLPLDEAERAHLWPARQQRGSNDVAQTRTMRMSTILP
jgi:hypothetical protein